jgi:hypothetical protein
MKVEYEMGRFLSKSLVFAALLLATTNSFGQTNDTTTQTAGSQGQVVGIVTLVDNAAGRITIKSEAGDVVSINLGSGAAVLRLPAGETSAQKAMKIALADISVGERLFARGVISTDKKSIDARQVVVTSGGGVANSGSQERQGEEFRQRGLMGRITALHADKKEIIVQGRGREGMNPVTVLSSDATRFFRYAPDSMDIKHASRSSFSDLKIGDQIRALGNRNADGTQFTADEIIAGSTTRVAGQVTAINSAKNEFTLKTSQGQNITVAIGPNSSLRRVTPEAAAALEANRPARGDRERRRDDTPAREGAQDGRPRERRQPGGGGGGGQGRWRGGRGFQDMLQNLPALTINDLKKGDTVVVSGSEGADASHVTAIMLITGDQEFMTRFMMGPNRGPQNPGLPGDAMGGGVGSAERPPNP